MMNVHVKTQYRLRRMSLFYFMNQTKLCKLRRFPGLPIRAKAQRQTEAPDAPDHRLAQVALSAAGIPRLQAGEDVKTKPEETTQ
jgi:hypothetical protein